MNNNFSSAIALLEIIFVPFKTLTARNRAIKERQRRIRKINKNKKITARERSRASGYIYEIGAFLARVQWAESTFNKSRTRHF